MEGDCRRRSALVPAVPAGRAPSREQHLRLFLLEAHLPGVPSQGAHAKEQLEGRQWPLLPVEDWLTRSPSPALAPSPSNYGLRLPAKSKGG